jgi:hypothetical protein
MATIDLEVARREALFVSYLQESQHPSVDQVRAAIQFTVGTLGLRDCLARVAQEFGEHPETAVLRMRWVNEMVAWAYACPPTARAA